ncbi:hypothetical protein [Marivivens aquimaris]|uniref:hypothetical protein n=1 Tax=Marivivens aquimaris TaxID=2774876 RepID=UPI001882EEC5|nr:hypothetical protein [Marivivens aquimaris]
MVKVIESVPENDRSFELVDMIVLGVGMVMLMVAVAAFVGAGRDTINAVEDLHATNITDY